MRDREYLDWHMRKGEIDPPWKHTWEASLKSLLGDMNDRLSQMADGSLESGWQEDLLLVAMVCLEAVYRDRRPLEPLPDTYGRPEWERLRRACERIMMQPITREVIRASDVRGFFKEGTY